MLVRCIQLCAFSLVFSVISVFASSSNHLEDMGGNQTNPRGCPTWYLPLESNTNKCTCGDTLDGKIRCLPDEGISLLVGVCITYTDEQVLVGCCPFVPSTANLLANVYTEVPQEASDVDDFMCGSMNRTGLLCSQCQEGLSLAAMSYRRACVECSNPGVGVIIFLLLAFVPTTAFFVLVMVCSIDITSGPMNGALIVIQVILVRLNQIPSNYLFKSDNPLSYYPMLFITTFYGIWNLDFLRYVIPPFCISRSLTSLQAEALEYVIAVYPLLLIVITYICVELYDSEYRIMVALWAPCRKIFSSKCFKNFNVKYSLITTFATFLVLTYTKIFHISRSFLNFAEVKNATGDTVKTVLLIDASIPYMSATHIPYAVLAVFMLTIFNLLPLVLLLLYPMKCFQLLLGRFPGVNWHPLRAFMDIFQGCYKNGTDGTRDCRYFAAINLILRVVALFPIDDQGQSILRLIMTLMLAIALIAIVRPYQRDIFNAWEVFLYMAVCIVTLWALSVTYIKHHSLQIIYVFHTGLFIYVCFLYVAKILKTLSPSSYDRCAEKIKNLTERGIFNCRCNQKNTGSTDIERGNSIHVSLSPERDEDYPDRVNNPQGYEPLLAGSRQNSELTYGIN